jgi:hypothetical protein
LQLSSDLVTLRPHNAAGFIFLTAVGNGSWVLIDVQPYETVLSTHLQDNIHLQDDQDSAQLAVSQDKLSVGDNDDFIMERSANTAGVGKDFIIAGQKASGNYAGGRLKLRPGAGTGTQAAVSGTIHLQDGNGKPWKTITFRIGVQGDSCA